MSEKIKVELTPVKLSKRAERLTENILVYRSGKDVYLRVPTEGDFEATKSQKSLCAAQVLANQLSGPEDKSFSFTLRFYVPNPDAPEK